MEFYLNKVSLVTVSQSTSGQFGSLRFTGLDITKDFIKLFLIDLRSLLVVEVERVADGPLLGAFDGSLHELIVDGLLNHDSGAGATTLTLMSD